MAGLPLDNSYVMTLLNDDNVTQHEAGMLHVPSGYIVACDPACGTEPAFRRTISPGLYRVVAGTVASAGEGTRVAYLVLWIKDAPIVHREPAYHAGGDTYRYWVDAGLGCFVDASLLSASLVAIRAAIDAQDPIVLHGNWNYLNYKVGLGNLVMCRSGFGDGYYATYVGLDALDKAVCFITDFGVVGKDDERADEDEC
jgi:hypothetical protein